MKLKIFVFLLSAVLLISTVSVQESMASPHARFTYTKTDMLDGFWLYDFTFENTSTKGEYLYAVKFDFFDPDVFGYTLPSGWRSNKWEGWHVTDNLRVKADKGTFGLPAGETQEGFRFKANYDFPKIYFKATFKDNGKTCRKRGNADLIANIANNITVVPEPMSYVLFTIGGATFGIIRLLKKKKDNHTPLTT